MRGSRQPVSLLVLGGLVEGRRADLRIAGGVVTHLAPFLEGEPADEVLDATGQLVMPGLHDHHLHLRGLAALGASVVVGPPAVRDRPDLAVVLQEAARGSGGGWVRAVGYHDSVAGPLDRWVLDEIVPEAPVRVQHRSGALWVLNSRACQLLGLDGRDGPGQAGVERDGQGRPTGRLFRLDDWLGRQLPAVTGNVAAVSARLASLGVTGLTDATPRHTEQTAGQIADDVAAGRLVQRVCLMCPPDIDLEGLPALVRGPHKYLLDDTTLPDPASLAESLRASHDAGSPVAVHCVTGVQLVVTIEALRLAGAAAGDRIEHAAVVAPELVPALRGLGVTVVTNPAFVLERGDEYLREVEARDRPHLYPCASLLGAGVRVAAGTDAPFATADPWRAIEAAVQRRTASGVPLGPDEAVSAGRALALFSGWARDPATPRRLVPGEPADLFVWRRDELDGGWAGTVEGRGEVTATVVDGQVVHRGR